MNTLNKKEVDWLEKQGINYISSATQFKNALTNDVFLIATTDNKRFIFKRLNRQARTDADRESEFLVQQLGSAEGLTPKVIAHNENYKLQQYITGDLIPITTNNLNELITTQLHRIHKLPARYAPKQRLKLELLRLREQLPVSIDEHRFEKMLCLAAELDASSARNILCHGDLSLNNILQGNDKRIYILDWEYAVVACAAYDLAFCICINEFTEKRSKSLIASYYKKMSEPNLYSLDSLQKECELYFELFSYINELWSICFVENT